MVNCQMQPMRLMNGQLVPAQADQPEGREGTIAYRILEQHNTSGDMKNLKIRFSSLLSHYRRTSVIENRFHITDAIP